VTGQPLHLVVGPQRHGVVSFALALADSLTRRGQQAPVLRVGDWASLDGTFDHSGGVHVNFTDRLFGSTPADAADRMSALIGRCERAGARVTATLHDVPQAADGGNYRQRIDAYRTVCARLHGCATNSEHERSLVGEGGIAAASDVVVVPLPLEVGDAPVPRPTGGRRRSVAVLGFVYPGKGHPEVLAAMAGAPRDVELLAIGECSAGHDDLARDLAEAASRAGRRFTITGYVPDGALPSVLHGVSVPVAHHRHVSASGSLNSWIAAHRRPIAPVNRYTVEHDRRHPGTVRLYPDTDRGLSAAIESALAEPDSTWLADGVVSGSPPAETARLYAEALGRWHD
jgi:hypothetical protein